MKSFKTTKSIHLDLRAPDGTFEGDIKPGDHEASEVPGFVFEHLARIGLAEANDHAKAPKAPKDQEA